LVDQPDRSSGEDEAAQATSVHVDVTPTDRAAVDHRHRATLVSRSRSTNWCSKASPGRSGQLRRACLVTDNIGVEPRAVAIERGISVSRDGATAVSDPAIIPLG